MPSSCAAADSGSPHETPTRSFEGGPFAGRVRGATGCESHGSGASARLSTEADAMKLVTPACASTAESTGAGRSSQGPRTVTQRQPSAPETA
eukprot:scaffold257999_cov32-Tisochrysis_lutea.AAC.3